MFIVSCLSFICRQYVIEKPNLKDIIVLKSGVSASLFFFFFGSHKLI